jgi:osmotically-inducible protein OsmY
MIAGLSDAETLKLRVRVFLAQQRLPDVEQLSIDVNDDTVIVSGRLGTSFAENLCESCCRRVAGVRHVVRNCHAREGVKKR